MTTSRDATRLGTLAESTADQAGGVVLPGAAAWTLADALCAARSGATLP